MISPLLKIPYLRLKYKLLPNKAQKFWGQELLNSQGVTAKIGQVLGQGQKSELPKASISKEEARQIFKKSFKHDVMILKEGLAASMGQVFEVKLGDHSYALKILHPGLRKKLKKEIENLLLLGSHFAKAKGFAFNIDTFRRFLVEIFDEETDLIREAQFQEKFHLMFKNDPRFLVPEVLRDYSNEEVLCQTWITAVLAQDLRHFPSFDIFHFFFKSLLMGGVLHADLNDRNWGLTANQRVVVFDYGCTKNISERRINGFKKLVQNQDVEAAFLEFGVRLEATWFKGKEQELRNALFEPLLATKLIPDWSYSADLEEHFGDKVKLLREFTDPWILLMLRSLFSLVRIYQERRISIPIRELLLPYLGMKQDTASALQVHIEITEHERQAFFLSLPISSLRNLGLHVPKHVHAKIEEKGPALEVLVAQILKDGIAPRELFDVVIDDRRHRVWIGE